MHETSPQRRQAVPDQRWFDWLMAVLSAWLIGGAFVDGWAHTHGQVDTSFFTPWHAVFYTGFLAVAGALVGALVHQRVRRGTWQQALPPGYNLALLGVVIFGCGGVGDMLWHTFFGIEKDVEALVSPTHIMLGCGGWLMVGGPFYAAWQRLRHPEGRWHQHLPWLLSLTWMLSTGTFLTQIAHPVVYLWGGGPVPATSGWMWQALGVVGMLWDTGFLVGFILLTMRRWVLPAGALTLVIGLNAVAMGFLYRGAYPVLPVLARVVAALGAEVVYTWLRPSVQRPGAWRLFAAAVPVLLTTLHFGTLALTVGVWWSVHLWTGTIVLTGLVGLLVSLLLVPPPWPDTSTLPGQSTETPMPLERA
jgi:hypothetical protein